MQKISLGLTGLILDPNCQTFGILLGNNPISAAKEHMMLGKMRFPNSGTVVTCQHDIADMDPDRDHPGRETSPVRRCTTWWW